MSILENFRARKRNHAADSPSANSRDELLMRAGIRALCPHTAPSDLLTARVEQIAREAEARLARRQVRQRSVQVGIAAVALVAVGVNASEIAARIGFARAVWQLNRVKTSASLRLVREDFSSGKKVTTTTRTDGTNSIFIGPFGAIAWDEEGMETQKPLPSDSYLTAQNKANLTATQTWRAWATEETYWLSKAAFPFQIAAPPPAWLVKRPAPRLTHWTLDRYGRLSSAVFRFPNGRLANVTVDPRTGLPTRFDERAAGRSVPDQRLSITRDAPFPPGWNRFLGINTLSDQKQAQKAYVEKLNHGESRDFPFPRHVETPRGNYVIRDAFRSRSGDIFLLYTNNNTPDLLRFGIHDQYGNRYVPVDVRSSEVRVPGTFGGPVSLMVDDAYSRGVKAPLRSLWLTPLNPKAASAHRGNTVLTFSTRSKGRTYTLYQNEARVQKASPTSGGTETIFITPTNKPITLPVSAEEPFFCEVSQWPGSLRYGRTSTLTQASLAQLRADARKTFQHAQTSGK